MSNVINAQQLFNRVRMWLSGVQYQGHRDLYQTFGWKREPDFRDFVASYYRQGIAKRVIDAPVLATWADPPQMNAANQDFNDTWGIIVEELSLWHNIIRLDKLAGLGKYAVMVVGFDDGQDLSTDASNSSRMGRNRKRKIIYLQPYHEGACSVQTYDTDSTSPRFGKPLMYTINPGKFLIAGVTSTLTQGMNAAELRKPFRCHYSRLIHVAENLLEDGVFGTSRLEVVFNDLCDLLKVTGGSAEVFWMVANRGMQVDVDKDMELPPEDMDQLQQEVEDYQHQLRRFIRTRGVKITNLGGEHVDPLNVFKIIMQTVSAGTGIPQLILMGAGTGQISSRNDRANWSDRIAERISEYAQPVVLKNVMDCFINAGALPQPQDLQISWPEAFKLDPLERAQTSAQMARSAVNLTKAATIGSGNVDDTGQPVPSGPLFSNGEMRRIVSFGKHPPVFDSPVPEGEIATPGSADDPALSKGGSTARGSK